MLAGAHGLIQVLAIVGLTGSTSIFKHRLQFTLYMWYGSLYHFGFKQIRPDKGSSISQEKAIPDVDGLMPSVTEARSLGIGKVEYEAVKNNASEILSSQNKN